MKPHHRVGRLSLVAACLLSLLPGCVVHYGPAAEELGATPRGASGTFESGGTSMTAELLAVEADGLVLRGGTRIVRMPWMVIDAVEVDGLPDEWSGASVPSPENREWLRLISRFPLGLDAEGLEGLLDFHGQDQPDVIGAPVADAVVEPAPQLLAQARSAALRFRSPEEARLSGYRPIGPDFPGMGQHWVNAFILLRGGTDPEQPPFLTYLDTPSGTVLTGLALGRVLSPGEGTTGHSHDSAWHDHSGTIDEELLALNPDAARHADQGEFRLEMLHLWTDLENPEGPFAQDNWAVPFTRLGLPVPTTASAHAGKALFLASGGDRYYGDLVDALVTLDLEENRAVDAALTRHRDLVEARIAGGVATDVADVWPSLWGEIRAGVTPEHWVVIEELSW